MHQTTDAQYQVASLYVGDLKQEVHDQMLWQIFSGFGQILSVKVCKDSTTSMSLGYAYVNFRTMDDAEKAMNALNYTNIEGKPCRIMWSMRDSQKRRTNIGNLFLKNIDASIDSRALFEAFSVFGPIMSCKLVTDSYGKSKGFGFIQFCNERDAETALEKANGVEFLNKKIMVTRFLTKSQRLGDSASEKPKFTNVFCKNFGEEWNSGDLESIFGKFGKITSCVVMNDSNGSSKGFGFINFEKPECAQNAVDELTDLKTPTGRLVYVARAMKKAERVEMLRMEYFKKRQESIKKCQNLNVYIKPLDPEMTEDKLREHFEKFGTIVSHRVMRDITGRSRGFGFVCYSAPEEAQRAIQEMDKKIIETKPLFVTLAQTREERRRELMAQNINRVPVNQMYHPGPFPVVYPPQQFNQGYPMIPQTRYPSQVQFSQRPLNRGIPPANPQVLANHSRMHPLSYSYNMQYISRAPRANINSGILQQQQLKQNTSQSRSYQQQYSQGHPYQQGPDSQHFLNHGVATQLTSVQAAVNYVESAVNNGEANQIRVPSDNSSVPQPTLLEHTGNTELDSAIRKILFTVTQMYENETNEYRARLTNTVVDSIKGDTKKVENEAALRGVITRAAQFLARGDKNGTESASVVGITSST